MSTSADLDRRYGRTGRDRRTQRLILLIAGGLFALVFLAWVVWAGLDGTAPTLEARDTKHAILDEHAVRVEWNLSVAPGTPTACVVEALNPEFVVVGWKVVEIPPSNDYTRSFSETVRTAQQSNTGLIYRCWLT